MKSCFIVLFSACTFFACALPQPSANLPPYGNSSPNAARDQDRPALSIESKYDLWRSGVTVLRGTNIWQRRSTRKHTETECLPPDLPPEQNEVIEPYYEDENIGRIVNVWKANYLNLSIPGFFYEEKREVEEMVPQRNGRLKKVKSKKYIADPIMEAELKRWLSLANKYHFFVVVAFRTGPGRTENAFKNNRRSPSLVFDEKKGKEAEDAQTGWSDMWKAVANLLKNNPYVVGYDLMVEPDTKQQAPLWNKLAGSLIKTIRDVDSDTPILVEAPDDALPGNLQGLDFRTLDPNNEQKLVYCVHQYEPTVYTQQNEDFDSYSCKTGESEGKNIPPYGSEGDYEIQKAGLDNAFNDIKRWRDGAQEYYRQQRAGNPRIKDTRVALAVNEFGIVRWAGRRASSNGPYPSEYNGARFIADEYKLLEDCGFNHAIWKWDPDCCLGDDGFNFRHPREPNMHSPDVDTDLAKAIKHNWLSNGLNIEELVGHLAKGPGK